MASSLPDDWCNWGDDNQYPKTLMEKVSKVGSAVGGLDVLISAHYGMGVKIYELMETDGDAVFKEKIPSSVPEIYDFFDRTQFELVMADVISDYETFGIAFPEVRELHNKKDSLKGIQSPFLVLFGYGKM